MWPQSICAQGSSEDAFDVLHLTSSSSTSSIDSKLGAKSFLPLMKLPTFDGNPLQWVSFWEFFQNAISQDSSLTDVRKLYYLRDSIKSIEGQQMVTDAITNGKDFLKVVKELQQLYDRRRSSYRSHVLMMFSHKTVASKDGIKDTLLIWNQYLGGLKQNGPEDQDSILTDGNGQRHFYCLVSLHVLPPHAWGGKRVQYHN